MWTSSLELPFSPSSNGEEQEHPIFHPGLPFTSGTWTFYHAENLGRSKCFYGIKWQDVDVGLLSQVHVLEVSVFPVPRRPGRAYPPTRVSTTSSSGIAVDETFLDDVSGYAINATTTLVVRIDWSMKPCSIVPVSPPAEEFAQRHFAMLASPFHNNVQFIFPRDGGRELWANGDLLAASSSYFQDLLESQFAEGENKLDSPVDPPPRSPRFPLPYDDSDDDETLEQTLAPAGNIPPIYRRGEDVVQYLVSASRILSLKAPLGHDMESLARGMVDETVNAFSS